jgi:hypothetical protein
MMNGNNDKERVQIDYPGSSYKAIVFGNANNIESL